MGYFINKYGILQENTVLVFAAVKITPADDTANDFYYPILAGEGTPSKFQTHFF